MNYTEANEYDVNAVDTAAGEPINGELDFSGFADEPTQGAWPDGWYSATISEGYATKRGFEKHTEDVVSQKGDSRNLRICFRISNAKGEVRNLQEQFNYVPDLLLTKDGVQALQHAREAFKNEKSWPGEAKSMQSSSITMGRLGQLQKATGRKLVAASLTFGYGPLVGASLDVRLSTDKSGYNVVKEFAPAGTKVAKKK